MGGIFSKHRGDKKDIKNFVGKPEGKSELKKSDHISGALKNKCEK
jgi:hypothetical protein